MNLDIKRFSAEYEALHGYCLVFMPLAVLALISEGQQSGQSVYVVCNNKFKGYQAGLSLINQNTGQTVFKIGKLAIDNPTKELINWVTRSTENAILNNT